MVKVKKIMSACMVYIIGGHLCLYYSEKNKNVDIMFHEQVLALSKYMLVRSGHYDRLLPKINFHLGFINNKC